jgi:hypothetical protein
MTQDEARAVYATLALARHLLILLLAEILYEVAVHNQERNEP